MAAKLLHASDGDREGETGSTSLMIFRDRNVVST